MRKIFSSLINFFVSWNFPTKTFWNLSYENRQLCPSWAKNTCLRAYSLFHLLQFLLQPFLFLMKWTFHKWFSKTNTFFIHQKFFVIIILIIMMIPVCSVLPKLFLKHTYPNSLHSSHHKYFCIRFSVVSVLPPPPPASAKPHTIISHRQPTNSLSNFSTIPHQTAASLVYVFLNRVDNELGKFQKL